MEQYNKTQIKKIIRALEGQMSSASGKSFDKLERARRDLNKWDGTGTLPHEKILRELNVLDDSPVPGEDFAPAEETFIEEIKPTNTVASVEVAAKQNKETAAPPAGVGMPGNEEIAKVLDALLDMIKTNRTNREQNRRLRSLAEEIDDWRDRGCQGDIPRLGELQELGLWSKPAPVKITPASVEPAPEPLIPAVVAVTKPVEVNNFKDVDRLVAEGHLYEAIQILGKMENAEGVDKRLMGLREELKFKTKKLVEKARWVEKEQAKDFASQKTAWRGVQDANPDYQEAREALRAVEQAEIRHNITRQSKERLQHAEEGRRLGNLPMLNKALAEIQALLDQVKKDLSLQDLLDSIVKSAQSIEKLRRDTREKLGTIATAEGQSKYGEAYEEARKLLEQSQPKDAPPRTIILENGSEELLEPYLVRIREKLLAFLEGKAAEYIASAKTTADTSPQTARNMLIDALNILADGTLTKDDLTRFEVSRNNINNEIRKIDEKVTIYEKARKLVVEGQNRALLPSERLGHLKEAHELFPNYQELSTKIENAEYDYASELARKGDEAVVQARYLDFEKALETIKEASGAITTAFQDVSKYPVLQNSLNALDKEKGNILSQKVSYEKMLKSLPKVEKYLAEYDAGNAGALKAARALFDDIQREHPRHRLVEEMSSELVKRQGDPDNWDSGTTHYNNQEWSAAEKALREISASFQHYDHAKALLDCSRVALLTLSGREAVARGEWDKAINAFKRALALYEAVSRDDTYEKDVALVASFGEESRNAADTIRDNEKRSSETLEKFERKFKNALNTIQDRHLTLSKVEPVAVFKEIQEEYENSKGLTRDKLFKLLIQPGGVYTAWLKIYLDGINAVLAEKVKNRKLLMKAHALANELEEVGLLSGHESLACQLQADLLDLDYSVMDKTSSKADLEKVEENRRDRLNVQRGWPFDVNDPEQVRRHEQKIQELDRTIRDVVDQRMKSDMERRLNRALVEHGSGQAEAQGAYSEVLLELENDDRLSGSVNATTSLIRVAWKAHEWQKAEALARRLRENTGANFVVISDQWLSLGKAAQAFSENNVDDALEYCKRLPKTVDKDLRAAKTELENETLLRLIEDAKKDVVLNNDSGYMEAAKKFALAYKLAPGNQSVAGGLKRIGEHVGQTIMNMCASAESLQLRGVSMDDLNSACREAHAQYSALSNFANVSERLNLKQQQVDSIKDATQSLETKGRTWDGVKILLDSFEKDLGIALNQPEKIDPRKNTGGWNLDALERYLQEARQEARKVAGRDVQLLGRLIENKLADWNYKKDTAGQLNKLVFSLMDAVAAEDFDQVIARATQLDEDWRKAQRDYGFEGLKMLVFETFNSLGRAETPLEHREIAIRQKQNLEEWSRWVVGVKDKQATLSAIQRELQFRPGAWRGLSGDAPRSSFLDQRFSVDAEFGIGMALKEIIQQCDMGRQTATVFQEYFQSRPASKPISGKAQAEASKVDAGWTDSLGEFLEYLVALRSEAEKRIIEVEKVLLPQLRVLVRGVESVASKDGRVPRSTFESARLHLEKCKRKDPYNREIDALEQKLNGFSPK